MGRRWYVVQTKSDGERLAENELRKQNFTVFNPTYVDFVERRSAVTRVVKSLFPTYIFVEFDFEVDPWRKINYTRGCFGLVGCGEEFASPVPVGCVEDLIDRQDEAGNIKLEEAVQMVTEFKEGMEIGIRGENYVGMTGTYCFHTKNRVTLLLALLSSKIRVTLPLDSVYPIINPQTGDGGSPSKQDQKEKS